MSNKKVIINADDFGITRGVNKAIADLSAAKVISSTTVMANMDDYSEVVALPKHIGVGIHFNLTVGRPAADPGSVSSLIGKDGSFFCLNELLQRVRQGKILVREVEAELRAQVQRILDLGIVPDHFDSHQSLLKHPFFVNSIKKIGIDANIRAVRTYVQRQFDYRRLLRPRSTMISIFLAWQKRKWRSDGFSVADRQDSLLCLGLTSGQAIQRLEKIFSALPVGILELAVHPGYDTEKNKALGAYVHEREVEAQVLASDAFKKIVQKSGVQLIRFSDIGT